MVNIDFGFIFFNWCWLEIIYVFYYCYIMIELVLIILRFLEKLKSILVLLNFCLYVSIF